VTTVGGEDTGVIRHGGKEECRWMYRGKRGVTGMTSDDSRRRRYWSDTRERLE
jgi:hypothetical protein